MKKICLKGAVYLVLSMSIACLIGFVVLKKEEHSTWIVYWDLEDLEHTLSQQKDIHKLSFFAAYFDPFGNLFVPEEITEVKRYVDATDVGDVCKHYLTIVNDKLNHDGSSKLKDPNILKMLLENEKMLDVHISQIVALALEGHYDGVEIDYEAIRHDEILWNYFITFVEKLYAVAVKEDLEVRIILEPSAPMDTLTFPVGPEYVVMCYNLHGYGTSPGPKADKAFLQEVVLKAAQLPGQKEFVLAAGGFEWLSTGQVRALTENDAQGLISSLKGNAVRDDASGALYYQYHDEEGTHTVWYADQETLLQWTHNLEALGVRKIGIWRIGG